MTTLRQPRWVAFAVFVVALMALCILAGRWQWHRWHDRLERNAAVEAAAAAEPSDAGSVLLVDAPLTPGAEFSKVSASGSYDLSGQVLVRNHNGRGGFEVLTPLLTDVGAAVIVDRGWLPQSTASAAEAPAVPDPPAGPVDVILRLRPAEAPAANADLAPAGQTYSIDVDAIAADLPYPVYGGYGELVEQDPAVTDDLVLPEPPPLGSGPHFFYAIQWWFFAALALVGFVLLARRESDTAPQAEAADGPTPSSVV